MIVVHVVVLGFIAMGIIFVIAFCIRATLLAQHLRGVLSLQGRNEPEVATANFVEAVAHCPTMYSVPANGVFASKIALKHPRRGETSR